MIIHQDSAKSTPAPSTSAPRGGGPSGPRPCFVCNEPGPCGPADSHGDHWNCANRSADTDGFRLVTRNQLDPRFCIFAPRVLNEASTSGKWDAPPPLPDLSQLADRLTPGWNDASRNSSSHVPPEYRNLLNEHRPGWDGPPEVKEFLGRYRPDWNTPRNLPAQPGRTHRGRDQDAELVRRRASAYLARMEPSLQGSNGSAALMAAARAICWGFDLGEDDGFDLLAAEFNPRCLPPWGERELRKKCRDAMNPAKAKYPRGSLRDADNGSSAYAGLAGRAGRTNPMGGSAVSQGSETAAKRPTPAECAAVFAGPRWTDPINPPVCEAGCRAVCGCVGEVPLDTGRVVPRHEPGGLLSDEQRLMLLFGNQQVYAADCPNRFVDHWLGDDGSEVFVEAACDAWSCTACQARRRWLEKRDHCPIVFRHATHIFEGTATAWTNMALRLRRAGVEFHFRWLMTGLTQRTVFLAVASDPRNILADLPEVEPCRGIDAAGRYAACVDALPSALPKGTKKSWQSEGWGQLGEQPETVEQESEVGSHDSESEESPSPDSPVTVTYRRSGLVPRRSLDEIADYLSALRMAHRWGVLQSESDGGAVSRSLGYHPEDPVVYRLIRRFAFRPHPDVEQAAALLGGATDEPIPD